MKTDRRYFHCTRSAAHHDYFLAGSFFKKINQVQETWRGTGWEASDRGGKHKRDLNTGIRVLTVSFGLASSSALSVASTTIHRVEGLL